MRRFRPSFTGEVEVIAPSDSATVFLFSKKVNSMKAFSRSMAPRSKARRGFTLIELIVVLMILTALAGLAIPAVTSMVTRTHGSSGAANIAAISNAISRYEVQYLTYPNRFDSLKNTLNSNAAGDFDGLDEEFLAFCTPLTLTTSHVDALAAAGITNLQLHADIAAADATFQLTTTSGSIAANDVLLSITDGANETLQGLDTAGTYVLLGVGNQSEMIGRTLTDAPVHFPESGNENPAVIYNRFLAVFEISGDRAKFVKVISPHFTGLDGHVQDYFETVNE